jgi:hypothetical protein
MKLKIERDGNSSLLHKEELKITFHKSTNMLINSFLNNDFRCYVLLHLLVSLSLGGLGFLHNLSPFFAPHCFFKFGLVNSRE